MKFEYSHIEALRITSDAAVASLDIRMADECLENTLSLKKTLSCAEE